MTPDTHEEVLLLQTLHHFELALGNEAQGAPIMWILAKAQADAVDAMRALTAVDPHDWKAVQRLQNDVQRQIDLKNWMTEAVVSGQQLYESLTANEKHFVGEFARDSESSEQVRED